MRPKSEGASFEPGFGQEHGCGFVGREQVRTYSEPQPGPMALTLLQVRALCGATSGQISGEPLRALGLRLYDTTLFDLVSVSSRPESCTHRRVRQRARKQSEPSPIAFYKSVHVSSALDGSALESLNVLQGFQTAPSLA